MTALQHHAFRKQKGPAEPSFNGAFALVRLVWRGAMQTQRCANFFLVLGIGGIQREGAERRKTIN